MKKIIYFIISSIIGIENATLIVVNDKLYGDGLRDFIALSLTAFCITAIVYFLLDHVEEIERKRRRKRDNELLYLENQIRRIIDEREN